MRTFLTLLAFFLLPALTRGQYCYDLLAGATSSEASMLHGYQNMICLVAKDGTNPHHRLTSVNIASGAKTVHPYDAYQFITIGNDLYFSGNPDTGKRFTEIWKFNPNGNHQKMTDLSTCYIKFNFVSGTDMNDLVVLNNKIYFFFSARTILTTDCLRDAKSNVFEYDPASNTTRSCDIPRSVVSVSPGATAIRDLVAFKNKLYFCGYSSLSGEELWSHDPQTNATTLVANIAPGNKSSFPIGIMTALDRLFFIATANVTDSFGWELYEYMGTGTAQRVTDLNPKGGHGVYNGLMLYKNQLYFPGFDGVEGGLFKYDLSSRLTARVVTEPGDRVMMPIGVHDGQLFYLRTTANQGKEMWQYNLNQGTSLVADMMPGNTDGKIHSFLSHNGNMFFCAETPTNGKEFFSYKGFKVGVDDMHESGADIMVYPNPASSALHFDITSPAAVYIGLSDATGKAVYGQQHTDKNIVVPIAYLPQGMYIYSIRTTSGELLKTGKILKQ